MPELFCLVGTPLDNASISGRHIPLQRDSLLTAAALTLILPVSLYCHVKV